MVEIEMAPHSCLEGLDLKPRGRVQPSPESWRDQVIYFLLPDRFSNESEEKDPFDWRHPSTHRIGSSDESVKAWRKAGRNFVGGNLKGIESKLSYLKELGVTVLWIGPVWKQRKDSDTYHGYAIQNFLEVDPRFGTRRHLRDLVDAAHALGIYVILDIVYNHTGHNWFYSIDGEPRATVSYRFVPPYPFHGWRSKKGESIREAKDLGPEDGVWPKEFQDPDWYVRAGSIQRWTPADWEDPLHPDAEFRRGDIYELKKLAIERDEVLHALIKVYQYWIALSDCDGFRIDSLKHVSRRASREFSARIHEFTEQIGKERFLLVGEVAGNDEMAKEFLEIHGRNIDAVLDICQAPNALSSMAKGLGHPREFFSLFEGREALCLHRRTGSYHISILDDHDMLCRPKKERFAANNHCQGLHQQVAHAVGVQLTTLGIPCIYYGTEQAFDGTEERGVAGETHPDRYIREAMFGGEFGAFATTDRHFFNRCHPTYLRIAAIAKIRNAEDRIGMTLRRGRQYLREISVDGGEFRDSDQGELVAWSRIHDGPDGQQEVLVVMNTHGDQKKSARVTVDSGLHEHNSSMRILYDGSMNDNDLCAFVHSGAPLPTSSRSVESRAGRAMVGITDLAAGGMFILA